MVRASVRNGDAPGRLRIRSYACGVAHCAYIVTLVPSKLRCNAAATNPVAWRTLVSVARASSSTSRAWSCGATVKTLITVMGRFPLAMTGINTSEPVLINRLGRRPDVKLVLRRSCAGAPVRRGPLVPRTTASVILGVSPQPDTRLIEHLVRQRTVVACARQDHRPDHRCPGADRRLARFRAVFACGDAAEPLDLLLDARRHFGARSAGLTDRLRGQGRSRTSTRQIIAMRARQIFGRIRRQVIQQPGPDLR